MLGIPSLKKVWSTLEDSSSMLCFLKVRYHFVIINIMKSLFYITIPVKLPQCLVYLPSRKFGIHLKKPHPSCMYSLKVRYHFVIINIIKTLFYILIPVRLPEMFGIPFLKKVWNTLEEELVQLRSLEMRYHFVKINVSRPLIYILIPVRLP